MGENWFLLWFPEWGSWGKALSYSVNEWGDARYKKASWNFSATSHKARKQATLWIIFHILLPSLIIFLVQMVEPGLNVFSFSQKLHLLCVPEWTKAVSTKWISLDQGCIPSDFAHKILIRERHYQIPFNRCVEEGKISWSFNTFCRNILHQLLLIMKMKPFSILFPTWKHRQNSGDSNSNLFSRFCFLRAKECQGNLTGFHLKRRIQRKNTMDLAHCLY